MTLEFRAATQADHDWLFELDRISMAAHTVPDALAQTITQQCERFDRHFDPAKIEVIMFDGKDCGVLRVETRDTDLYLAVIEIAPEAQGHGIGSAVMQTVLARARAKQKSIALRVYKTNVRARQFYERLGFHMTSETDTKIEMRHDG